MRWKAFIPAVLLAALSVVFVLFFMDGFAKRALEKAGTAANGAKVELDGVNISLKNFSVTLRHLQVADKEDPMTNSLEVDSLKFDLAGKPLAWKKFIIEKGEISGIRTGTPRKTSGAVPQPAKKETAEEQKPSKLVEFGKEAGAFAWTNLKDQYDPKKMIQLENLASYKKVQEEQSRLTTLTQDWETRVNGLDVRGKSDEVKALVEKAKTEKFSGLEGLKKAQEILKDAKKTKGDLEAVQKTAAQLKDALQVQMAMAKESLKQIDDLKKQDIDSKLGELKSGAFSGQGITRGLIGPVWAGRLQTGLSWFGKIRKYMPKSKPGAKPPPPPKRRGRDIPFPFFYKWPLFHLKIAQVSGMTSGDNPLSYEGSLKDVTSDPKLVGRPIALDLASKKESGPRSFTLHAELDYTGETPREAVRLNYKGMTLAGMKLGNVGAPVAVKSGSGALSTDLEVRGEALAGKILFTADPLALEQNLSAEQAKNRLLSIVHDVLARLNRANVTLILSDTLLSPNVKMETDIDNMIEKAVKGVFQKELDDVKAQVRARVNELVDAQKQKLTDMVNDRISSVTGKFGDKDKTLQSVQEQLNKAMDDLKNKGKESLPLPGGGSGDKPSVPNLKNLFKKK